jgi:6-phosphogluconolactonase
MRSETLVYVGTYTEAIRFGSGKLLRGNGEGIHVYRLDESSGALEPVRVVAGVVNPSYLAFDPARRFLYAVNELKSYRGRPGGSVSAFRVEPTGELTPLNARPTHGTDPCHVVVSGSGRHVFVANFMSGSVCVLPVLPDGGLGEACDFVQHLGASIDPARQQGPHAHSVTLDPAGRFACIPDLGLDKLLVYRVDAKRGRLEPTAIPWIKMKPGAGPRHLAFHPSGKHAYLINELDSTLAVLSYDARRGAFAERQIVPALPEGYRGASSCSDVQVSPSGRFVYGSNRGHDSVAIFRSDPRSGRLTPLGHAPTRGKTPRGFGIDPAGRFLLAANQDSDSIVTFRIDPRSGALTPTGQVAKVPTPVCVKFLTRQVR